MTFKTEKAGDRFARERRELLAKARATAEKATAEGRGMTPAEQDECRKALARCDEIDHWKRGADEGDAIMAQLGSYPHPDSQISGEGFLKWNPAMLAKSVLSREGHGSLSAISHVKSLIAEGSSVTSVPMFAGAEAEQRAAMSLLDLIPAQVTSREFSYLSQTLRTNNAAPVAVGDLKPTSVFTLDRVEDRLSVIAHLSEPVDEFWLADNASLTQFLSDELIYGLRLAVEDQILNGDGLGENLTGLETVSGIQAQAFATDPVRTARAGLGRVELLGYQGSAYLLNPADWEVIETSVDADGRYQFDSSGAPIDRATRRLWGVPVALSTSVTAGAGWLLSEGSGRIYTDGAGIAMKWGVSGDDFQRNQVRARCEGRFGFGVQRPSGVVKLDLTAA